MELLLYVLVAMFGSIMGSMLGLGGGIIIIPLFTIFLGVDPKVAVAASAVSIVTNSVVGSTNHLNNRFVNIRLAMVLESIMAVGAIIGALIAVRVSAGFLEGLLGVLLLYSAYSMLRGRNVVITNATAGTPDPLNMRDGFAETNGNFVEYVPQRVEIGCGASAIAGVLSGLLGIGGGIVQVPVMNLLMNIPVRAATGTSSFMIGMTGVATATVFYANRTIDPQVTVPAMIGVFLGSNIGSTLTKKLRTDRLVIGLVLVMLYLGLQMMWNAFGGLR